MDGRTLIPSRPLAKVGVVLGGYVVALLVAYALVSIYVAVTSGPDRQVYGAMFGFGDGLLFLALFAIAAIPASAAGLFFLRPYRWFWLVLSVLAVGIAGTSLAALYTYVTAQAAVAPSWLHAWSAFAVLRLLVAPIFAAGFFLCGLIAPSRSFRLALLLAAFVEASVCAYIALTWFHPFQLQR